MAATIPRRALFPKAARAFCRSCEEPCAYEIGFPTIGGLQRRYFSNYFPGMVNEHAYAPTLTETTRNNIRAACDALIAATGLTDTLISRVVKGDSAFIKRLPTTSINIRTYDEVMGRLSAAWPEEVEWPASVPRPAPVAVPDAVRADLEAALIKHRAIRAQEAAREARRLAREAKAAARHVSGRSGSATAGGEQAPAHP